MRSRWDDFSKKKTISPKQLPQLVEQLRKRKKKIATLNGSFDLLHAGHLYILYEASLVADVLIVALNSDASIQSYKGPQRPLITLDNRIQLLTALAFVDYVTWFDDSDPRRTLEVIRPDVHVNGAEYGEECIEADTVAKIGAKLHLVKRIDGLATSEIVEKIKCV